MKKQIDRKYPLFGYGSEWSVALGLIMIAGVLLLLIGIAIEEWLRCHPFINNVLSGAALALVGVPIAILLIDSALSPGYTAEKQRREDLDKAMVDLKPVVQSFSDSIDNFCSSLGDSNGWDIPSASEGGLRSQAVAAREAWTPISSLASIRFAANHGLSEHARTLWSDNVRIFSKHPEQLRLWLRELPAVAEQAELLKKEILSVDWEKLLPVRGHHLTRAAEQLDRLLIAIDKTEHQRDLDTYAAAIKKLVNGGVPSSEEISSAFEIVEPTRVSINDFLHFSQSDNFFLNIERYLRLDS